MNKYVIFKKIDNIFYVNKINDEKLYLLGQMLTNFGSTNWIKNELLDRHSNGITGNSIRVDILDNNVSIHSLFDDSQEYLIFEIRRNILLEIVIKWSELVQKKAQEITISQDEIGNYSVTGTF